MSLIAKYNFDSTDYNSGNGRTIFDQSGNGNDLVKSPDNNSGSWDTDDPYADTNIYSFHFNTNQHFEKTLSSTYSGDFSISIWFKPDVTMGKHDAMFASSSSNNDQTFQIGTANSGTTLHVQVNRGSGLYFDIGTYSVSSWNHAAITFNNSTSTLKTYMGGSLQNTWNTSTSPSTSSLNFDISHIKVGTNRNENNKFDGYITCLQVFDEELNATAIGTLFSSNEHCYHSSTNILTDYGYINITKLIKNINVKNKFIKFTKNSIGKDIPNEDLMITSGHPVYFNDEYYLPENFLELEGVDEVCENSNNVYHLVFDTHEVVYSNALMTTSLPPNTTCDNMALKEDEYYDKKNYKKENQGKMYPPYILHENPLFMKKLN